MLLLLGVLVGCGPETEPAREEAAAHLSGLRLIGHTDLGGVGLNGPAATVGQTALVAAGILPGAGIHTHFYNPYPCPAVNVKVVDLTDPAQPRVAATIPVPAGVAASDVAALRVSTAAFQGDLVAVALARCNAEGNNMDRGVAYYDVSNPTEPVFLGRYFADVDSLDDTSKPACGPAPEDDPDRCAASQHTVHLVQREDGRVLSLSTEPGASASSFPSGDLRIVDVTDPRRPVEIGSFPEAGEPIFSFNGCRPFSAAHDAAATVDGETGLLAFFDVGLVMVDLADPAAPVERARLGYGKSRKVEGNAAYVAVLEHGGRTLALVSEEDWIGPASSLRVEAPASVARLYFGCPAMFTLFDAGDSTQVYRRPNAELAAEIAYVGRGCPANPDWGTEAPDPYLDDPEGKIALIDRMRQSTQPDLTAGSGCSLVERVKRAQEEGAVGAVMMQTNENAPEAFSPDGDVDYVVIPLLMIDKTAGDSLRAAVCPDLDEAGRCTGGKALRGALVDAPGRWGGVRLIDVTNPAAPVEVTTYHTSGAATFPPPDLGIYAPGPVAARDGRAYVAWHSDGLRVLDLSRGAVYEIAAFVPEDSPDPTGVLPGKALVVGVALLDPPVAGAPVRVVVSDLHAGLYVLELDVPDEISSPPLALRSSQDAQPAH